MADCYSLDYMVKKAFEREISRIQNSHSNNLNEHEELLINYMSGRIKEIEEDYQEG